MAVEVPGCCPASGPGGPLRCAQGSRAPGRRSQQDRRSKVLLERAAETSIEVDAAGTVRPWHHDGPAVAGVSDAQDGHDVGTAARDRRPGSVSRCAPGSFGTSFATACFHRRRWQRRHCRTRHRRSCHRGRRCRCGRHGEIHSAPNVSPWHRHGQLRQRIGTRPRRSSPDQSEREGLHVHPDRAARSGRRRARRGPRNPAAGPGPALTGGGLSALSPGCSPIWAIQVWIHMITGLDPTPVPPSTGPAGAPSLGVVRPAAESGSPRCGRCSTLPWSTTAAAAP